MPAPLRGGAGSRAVQILLFLLLSLSAFAVPLTPDSNLSIRLDGHFDNAGDQLTEMLSKYLLLALGKEQLTGTGNAVEFVLSNDVARWQELPPEIARDDIGELDRYTITVTGGTPATVRIHGRTARGCGYGITTFLEQYLGVYFLFPGELGIGLPPKHTFDLPVGTRTARPWFASRMYTGFVYRDPDKPNVYTGLYHSERLYFGAPDYQRSLRLWALSYASHNLFNIFNVNEFGKTEPDIYPLKDGKRFIPPSRDSPKGRSGYWSAWHPCYTNPRVTEIAIDKARKAFANGAHTFSLGINDGRRIRCECDACKAAGWPDAYYAFVTRVATAMLKEYPDRQIGLISYGDVRQPPASLHLPPNVMVEITGPTAERFDTWARHASRLGCYEYQYGGGFWVPNFPLDALKRNAAFYADKHVRFVHAEAYPVWAFDAPKLYLHSRLLWDPGFDVEAGLDRFCTAGYGAAGPDVAAWYRLWAKQQPPVAGQLGSTMDFSLWRNPERQFDAIAPSVYAEADRLLAQAAKRDLTPPQQARLAMLTAFHHAGETLYQAHRAMLESCFDKPPPAAAAARLASLQTAWDAAVGELEKHPEYFAGTSASFDESWGLNALGSLRRELEGALRLDLYRSHGQAPASVPEPLKAIFRQTPEIEAPKINLRPTHPWYPEPRYSALTTSLDGGKLSWQATPAKSLDDAWQSQMLDAFLLLPHARSRQYFHLSFDFQGSDGKIEVIVHGGSNNRGVGHGHFYLTLDADHPTRQLELMPETALLDAKTGLPVRDLPPHVTYQALLEVFVLWHPSAANSQLNGSCTFEQLSYPVPELPMGGLEPAKPKADDLDLKLDE